MKKHLIWTIVLALLLTSCQVGSTVDQPTTRPLPEVDTPEIIRNKEMIMEVVPIWKKNALGVAKLLYTLNVAEFVEVTLLVNDPLYFDVQVVDDLQDVYTVRLSYFGSVGTIWEKGSDEAIFRSR